MSQMENSRRKSNVEIISECGDFNEPPNSSPAGNQNDKTPKVELMHTNVLSKSENEVDVEAPKNEKAVTLNVSGGEDCNKESPASTATPKIILPEICEEKQDHEITKLLTQKKEWNEVQQNNQPASTSHRLSLANANLEDNSHKVSDVQESSLMKQNKSTIAEEREPEKTTTASTNMIDAPTVFVETSVKPDVTAELGVLQVTDSSHSDSQNQTYTSHASFVPLGLTQGLLNIRLTQRRPSKEVRIPPALSSLTKEMQYTEYQEPQVPIIPPVDSSGPPKVRDIVTSWEQRLEHNEEPADEKPRVIKNHQYLGQKSIHDFENRPKDQENPINHLSMGNNAVEATPIKERCKEGLVCEENFEEVNDDESNKNSTLSLTWEEPEDDNGRVNKFSVIESFPYDNEDDNPKESFFDKHLSLLLIIGFAFMASGLLSVTYLYIH